MGSSNGSLDVVEIEIDGKLNESHYFLPLQRRIRGRFDYMRVAEPKAKTLINEWPHPIPGQHITLNLATGEGQIREPLREEGNELLKEKCEKRGRIGDHEIFPNVDIATWCHWLKRAVESGYAKLIKGKFPEQIEGKPQISFFSRPQVDQTERLASAIENQTAVAKKQTELLSELILKLARK